MIQVGFSNGIGNFVIFTQILQCLVEHFKDKIHLFLDSEVTITNNEAISQIAGHLPFIGKVSYFPENYDPKSFHFMSQLNNLGPLYTEFVGDKVTFSSFKKWASEHVSETNLYLMELDAKIGYRGKLPPPQVPFLKKALLRFKESYVCVSNGYSEGFYRKSYSMWDEVLESIFSFYGQIPVVLLGSGSDVEWGESIVEAFPHITNLIEKTTILEAITMVKRSSLLLSVDTGLYHVADALGIPNIVLFGPTLTSKNGPINGSTTIIQTPRLCAPCQGTVFWPMCDEADTCMDLIEPSLVFSKVRSILPIP